MNGFWYEVESNDTLSGIAHRFGVSHYKKIWNHDKNKHLRNKLPDEHHIYPGNNFWIPNPDPDKIPTKTGTKKELKARTLNVSIISIKFRSDHTDSNGEKILRPTPGPDSYDDNYDSEIVSAGYKNAEDKFTKPEWNVERGGDVDSHPISHTKGKHIEIDVEIDINITPEGSNAKITRIRGQSSEGCFSFEDNEERVVSTQRLTVKGLKSKERLPDHVAHIWGEAIRWTVDFEDRPLQDIGTTGPHGVYVTLGMPKGKMTYGKKTKYITVDTPQKEEEISRTFDDFEQGGGIQHVTEKRLEYSINAANAGGNERDCVDAIFKYLKSKGVRYVANRRWKPNNENQTGITPKPSLHHYLWLCNANIAKGECHNIAAAFILACRILGVQEDFEVGYVYPWPSRKNDPDNNYQKWNQKTASGKPVMGKYNNRYIRRHSFNSHGMEVIFFLDVNGRSNHFEGVASYKNGEALYAIGINIYDKFPDKHSNASHFYADIKPNNNIDWTSGNYPLVFGKVKDRKFCHDPYPSMVSGPVFSWED